MKQDLSGQRFGSLSVIEFYNKNTKNRTLEWKCLCDCGNEYIAITSHLKNGRTNRCFSCATQSRLRGNIDDISILYWNQLKRSASKRYIKFEISKEYAFEIFIKQNKTCSLTNVPLIIPYSISTSDKGNASLDRIDSNFGYTYSNIQWVHKIINRMKSDMSQENFIKWCKMVG